MRALAALLNADGADRERDFKNAFWVIWPEEHRQAVAEGFWEVAEATVLEEATTALARHMRFRPVSIRRANVSQKAKWLLLLTRIQGKAEWALKVAFEYVFLGCQPLCEGLMEKLGIPHEAGIPTAPDYQLPSEKSLGAAVAWAREAYREWQLELLLAVIVSFDTRWRLLLSQHVPELIGEEIAALTPTVGSPATAVEATEEATEPEDTESFTTLDNLLIKTVVASLNNIEGALSLEAIEDLIEEVVELNADRHRSFFHRGYLDALHARELRVSFPGENASRRHWYLAGVLMGLTRLGRLDEVAGMYDSHRELVRSLLSHPAEGGAMVAPFVFRALRQQERWGEALTVAEARLFTLGTRFPRDLLSDGADMLRRGRIAEATQVLDFLHRRRPEILKRLRDVGADTARHFEERLDRKMAQCLQFQSELAQAREVLDRMLAAGRPRELASILADRGLIEGGFKALPDVRLPEKAEDEDQIRAALERGKPFFLRAVDEDPEYAMNAGYCLGVLATLRRDEPEAIARLTAALTGMSRQAEIYRVANVLPRTEFLLGLALLESLDAGRAIYATELLLRALRSRADVPLCWWARAVVAASMHGDTPASRVSEELCAVFGDAALQAVEDVPEALQAAGVRAALERRGVNGAEPIARRWGHWERLLRHALTTGNQGKAAEALDALEVLSQESPERERFLELLEDPRRYEPGWSREDVLWARVRLLEALGRYSDAAGVLAGVFHSILVDPSEQELENAHAIVDRIRGYGLRDYDLSTLERRLEAVARVEAAGGPPEQDDQLLVKGSKIQVVFVGGNETQARHDEVLRAEIEATCPRVQVEFIHTNMSSNWGRQLDDMRGRLADAHAVVVMRMIRTELGRAIRAMSKIWVPCIGKGRESMKRAILRAALVAARERLR